MNNQITQDVVVRLMIQSHNAPGAAASHNAAIERVIADSKRNLGSLETTAKQVATNIGASIGTQVAAATATASNSLSGLSSAIASDVGPVITRVTRDVQQLGTDGTAAIKSLTAENAVLAGTITDQVVPTIQRMTREVSSGTATAAADTKLVTTAVKGLTDEQVAGLSKVASAWQTRASQGAVKLEVQGMHDLEALSRQSLSTDALVAESKLAISKLNQLTSATHVKAAEVEAAATQKASGSVVTLTESFLGLESGSLAAAASAGAVAVAIGAVVAAAVIAVAIFASLFLITTKSTEAFADYGEKVHTLQQKLDISAESIARLNVISKETNTDLDQLARTTGRLEANISKGLSKPAGEAGRALKLLHLDARELANDSPEVQLQKVSKAILGVENASTKSRAASALAGVGFQELKPALEGIATKWDEAGKKAAEFGQVLTQSQVDAADEFKTKLADIGLATEGFLITVGSVAMPQILGFFNDIEYALTGNEGAWVKWADRTGKVIAYMVAGARYILGALKADLVFLSTLLATGNIGAAAAVGQATANAEDKRITNSILVDNAQRAVTDATAQVLGSRGGRGNEEFPNAPAKIKHVTTEAERLTKELAKTNAEIDALHNSGSKEFRLKFNLEDAQKFKSGLEEVLKLRHEMALPLRIELPGRDPHTGALSDAAQAQATELLRITKLQKSVYDDVTRAVFAQSEAEAKLAALRQEAVLPVINAITRADTKYAEGVIDRRNAEQELTGTIIANARLRRDAELDYVGQVVKAYQTIRLEQGKNLDQIREQRVQDQAFVLALSGGGEGSLDAAARQRAGNLNRTVTPTALQQVAQAAARLDSNVARIALKIVGAADQPGGGKGNGDPQLGGSGPLFNPEVGAARRNVVPPGQDGIVSLVEWGDAADEAEKYAGAVEHTDTVVQDLTLSEGALALARETAGGERDAREAQITKNILTNNERLKVGLVSFERDLADMRSTDSAQRLDQERAAALAIRRMEDDLADIERGDIDALHELQQNADAGRLSARLHLKQVIVDLEDQIAHAGEDSADRERAAYLSATRDIQKAHEDAAESVIRSQVRIQQQTVYNADIADAKVLEFLSNQKNVTDALADAKIGVIQSTFDLIDTGLNKAFAKLGSVGRLISSIISDLLKPQLVGFFAKLFGLSTQGQQGPSGLLNLASAFAPAGSLRANNTAGGLTFSQTGAGGGTVASGINFQNLLNRGATNPFASFSSSQAGPGFLPTIAQQQLQHDIAANVAGGVASAGAGAAGRAAAGTAAKGSLSASLAGILPALGLGVGAQLGGAFFKDSKAANLIGTVAGGALGLSAGLAGFLALGGSLGSGALAGAGAAIAGALPIIAPIAIAALIASYFINRSALRRKEEDLRSSILVKARNDIDAIIAQVKAGRLDGTSAIAQALAIRQQYLSDVGQLKDTKTRNIAIATVRELDARISTLRSEALKANRAADIDTALVPTFRNGGDAIMAFAGGGSYRTSQGGPSGIDYILAMLGNDETVVTPGVRAALGGDRRMRQLNVRGYNDGRAPRGRSMQDAGSGGGGAPPVIKAAFYMVPDEATADAMIKASAPDVIAQKLRVHVKNTKMSGVAGDIFEAAADD